MANYLYELDQILVNVEKDYDVHNPCRNGSDCCDNDYCRCGTIENIRITSVPPLVEMICNSGRDAYKHDIIFKYCLHRLFTIYKLYDTNNWTADAERGYYGEECGQPYLVEKVKIEKHYNQLLNLEQLDRIKYVLDLEYGYLTNEVQNATKYEIITIDPNKLNSPNDNHYVKCVSNDEYNIHYFKYDLPGGIVNSNMKIIDGHHRLKVACKLNKEITVIKLT